MSSGGGSGIIGYDYLFGIHMGISRGPVDEMVEIKVGDRTAWPTITVENPDAPPIELTREYPQNIVFSQPYMSPPTSEGGGEGPYQWVTMTIESPTSFVGFIPPTTAGMMVTITGMRRLAPISEMNPALEEVSLDGVYEIMQRFDSFTQWHSTDGGYMETVPARLVIQLPMDFPLQERWWRASQPGALVPPGAGPITMSVEDQGQGRYSSTATESCRIFIDAPDLFGGHKAEGGIEGPMDVMMGEATQVAPSGMNEMLGGPLPGYRGMFTAFFNGLISSMNPYPKPWKFRVRRALKGWDGEVWHPELALISMTRPMAQGEITASADIKAMNGAHIIYECLTNRVWGRGLPRTMIDEDAFLAAATTLFNEGFGLCLRWSRRDSIEAFVQSVLDHIGAALYTNRTTAKLSLKLIRGVDDISTLPLFDPDSGLKDVREASAGSAGAYVNEVKVKYVDPITDEERVVKVDNLAGLQANNGAFNSVERSFPGLPTPSLATRVAQRELRAVGVELRRFTLVLDRRAWELTPGDAIRIRDPIRGIKETVVRIGRFEDGTLTDGKITVHVVQDMFALPATSYVGHQAGVAAPSLNPCVARYVAFEMPYALLARLTPPADFNLIGPTDGVLGMVMERNSRANASYRIAVRPGLPTPDDEPTDEDAFCGYEPPGDKQYRLGGGTAYETAWYEDAMAAHAELVANYNELSAPKVFGVADGYPRFTDGEWRDTQLFRGEAGGMFTAYRIYVGVLTYVTDWCRTKAEAMSQFEAWMGDQHDSCTATIIVGYDPISGAEIVRRACRYLTGEWWYSGPEQLAFNYKYTTEAAVYLGQPPVTDSAGMETEIRSFPATEEYSPVFPFEIRYVI